MGDLSYLACRLPDKLRLRGEQRPDCQYQEQTPLKVKDFFTAQDQKSQPTTVETSGLCQLEPREAFEAMSLNDKGEQRGLFLSVNQARDGRPEEAYMDNSVVACQSPQPFLTASFGDADYNMSGSSGEEALFAKSGTGHLYPDEEEEEAVGQQEDGGGNRSQQLQEELPELPVMDKSASRQATFTPPPPQPTAQQQQPLSQEVLRTPSGRSHSAMVFLTPKEKYAKEVSAERKLESVQRRVVFDTDAADQFPAQQQQQLPQLQDSLQQQQQPQPSQVEEMPISLALEESFGVAHQPTTEEQAAFKSGVDLHGATAAEWNLLADGYHGAQDSSVTHAAPPVDRTTSTGIVEVASAQDLIQPESASPAAPQFSASYMNIHPKMRYTQYK